jgi:hypothetical protein
MAFKKSVETASGVLLPVSYIKIENTSGNAELQNITVCTYANEEAKSNRKEPVDQTYYTFQCSVEDGAPNFIKQGYEYLKTLPEFSAAIDVLE